MYYLNYSIFASHKITTTDIITLENHRRFTVIEFIDKPTVRVVPILY